MKTLKQVLVEALQEKQRYEKETGQKYSNTDQLFELVKEYKNKNDIFLLGTFVSVPKLGIYPKSNWLTPTGIYSYPLTLFSEQDIKLSNFPYAGSQPYLIVFTVKDAYRKNILVVEKDGKVASESGITEQQIQSYINGMDREKDFPHNDEFEEESNITKTFFYNVNKMAKRSPVKTNYFLINEFDVLGIIDKGSGLIHGNEPTQAVFFRKDILDTLLMIDNKADKNKITRDDIDGLEWASRKFNSDFEKYDVDWSYASGVSKKIKSLWDELESSRTGMSIEQLKSLLGDKFMEYLADVAVDFKKVDLRTDIKKTLNKFSKYYRRKQQ